MATNTILPPRDLWPVGFGFRPTEEELFYYLENKMRGNEFCVQYVREVDLYNYEPWELPELSVLESDNHEWFFFRAQPSYGPRSKTKRTTRTGHWKSTGEDRKIKARGTNKVIGTRKILVFHHGRAPNGVKTNWIIHEYHLLRPDATRSACQENAAEEKCDEDDRNSFIAPHLKRKDTEVAIKEVTETFPQANKGSQVLGPTLQSPRGAAENDFTDWLNSVVFLEDENFDDATVINSEPNLHSRWYSKPESSLMELQPPNGYDVDGVVNTRQFQQHEASSENEFSLTQLLSGFVEDEKLDDMTSNTCCSKDVVDGMVSELQGGFDSDTDNYAAPYWQNNHISVAGFPRHHSLIQPPQSVPIIKESRRSPLTVKHVKYDEEKDTYCLNKVGVITSDNSCEGEAPNCSISVATVCSGHGTTTSNQPKLNEIVACGNVPKRVWLQREMERNVVSSQDKLQVKEGEKGNRAAAAAAKCWMSFYEGNGFGYIITTKRIHHKSNLPLVYMAKAIVGIIMFAVLLQEMLLYGHWS